MPSSVGIAVEVRHISVSLKNSKARRSYCLPFEVTEMLKIVVVNEQLVGGVYIPSFVSEFGHK